MEKLSRNFKELQEQLKEKFEKEKKENVERQALLTEKAKQERGDIIFEEIPDFDDEDSVNKRGDISFEPPRDDEESSVKENIDFEKPVEPCIEDRLETLERGQGQIIRMLQVLIENITKRGYAGNAPITQVKLPR